MKKRLAIILISLPLLFQGIGVGASVQHESIFLNNGWSFAVYNGFDLSEAKWSTVNLPHDWVVDLPYEPLLTSRMIGWKYPENCVGWYKKTISIPETDKGGVIFLSLTGVLSRCTVYCNDAAIGTSSDGLYDLTDFLNYGSDNEIIVRVESHDRVSGKYLGAGLCGDAFLYKSPKVAVKPLGVRYNCELFGSKAKVNVNTTVMNEDQDAEEYVSVKHFLEDAIGTVVAESSLTMEYMSPFTTSTFEHELSFDYPVLWDIDLPYSYKLRTIVIKGGEIVDESAIPVSVRTFHADDNGTSCDINGRRAELRCCELPDSFIPVGSAVPGGYWKYLVEAKKAEGFNAVRVHNAPEALLDVCDRMGFMVIDRLDNAVEGIAAACNHPSVVMWNVSPSPRMARELVLARRLDPSRQIIEVPVSESLPAAPAQHKEKKSRKKAETILMEVSKTELAADGQDVLVVDIRLVDDKGNDAPIEKDLYIYVDKDMTTAFGIPAEDAKNSVKFSPVTLLGYSNDNPEFRETVREWSIPQILLIKTYQGKCQVLVRSIEGCSGPIHLRVGSDAMFGASVTLNYK